MSKREFALGGAVLVIMAVIVLFMATYPPMDTLAGATRFFTVVTTPRTRTPIPPTSLPPTPTPTGNTLAKGVTAFANIPDVMCRDVGLLDVQWIHSGWALRDCPFIDEAGYIQWFAGQRDLGPDLLIVWNELDQPGPGGGWLVSPCSAAQQWHDVIEPTYANYTLIGPGMTVWARGWMPQFWTCYVNKYGHEPIMPYVNVHCYSTGPSGRNCLSEFAQAAAWTVQHNRKLVIGEYASLTKGNPYHCLPYGCSDCQTVQQGLAEAKRVLDGLKQLAGVVAVSWYNTRTPGDDGGAMDCNSPLVDTAGNLTAFGIFYRDWR